MSAAEIRMPLTEARVGGLVGCNAVASAVDGPWELNMFSDEVSWGMSVGCDVASFVVVGAGGLVPLTAAAGLNAATKSVLAAVIEVMRGSETSGQSGKEHGSTEQQPLKPFVAHR